LCAATTSRATKVFGIETPATATGKLVAPEKYLQTHYTFGIHLAGFAASLLRPTEPKATSTHQSLVKTW
jgi:hypothetical protein